MSGHDDDLLGLGLTEAGKLFHRAGWKETFYPGDGGWEKVGLFAHEHEEMWAVSLWKPWHGVYVFATEMGAFRAGEALLKLRPDWSDVTPAMLDGELRRDVLTAILPVLQDEAEQAAAAVVRAGRSLAHARRLLTQPATAAVGELGAQPPRRAQPPHGPA